MGLRYGPFGDAGLIPNSLLIGHHFLDFTDGWCWRPFLDIADILPQREALKVL
jgi:hypothetical protein